MQRMLRMYFILWNTDPCLNKSIQHLKWSTLRVFILNVSALFSMLPLHLDTTIASSIFLYMAFIDEIESLITLHTFLPGLCKQTYFEFTQHSFLNANKGSEFPNMSFASMEGIGCLYSQLQIPDRPIILLLRPCSVPAVTACYKEKVVNSSHSFSHFTVHRSWWKMELFSSPFLCQLK